MKEIRWISALCATVILSTGVAAWASDLARAAGRSLTAGHDLKGVSAPPGHTDSAAGALLAGQDLSGVSAAPGRTSEAGTAGEASKASGPPYKSMPLLS